MSKNYKILLFSNIVILILLHLFYKPNEQNLLLSSPMVWLLLNMLAGGIIFFIDKELGKAFLLLGLTGLLIGGSVCGLGIMFWKIVH